MKNDFFTILINLNLCVLGMHTAYICKVAIVLIKLFVFPFLKS